jgi:hypothetical protein
MGPHTKHIISGGTGEIDLKLFSLDQDDLLLVPIGSTCLRGDLLRYPSGNPGLEHAYLDLGRCASLILKGHLGDMIFETGLNWPIPWVVEFVGGITRRVLGDMNPKVVLLMFAHLILSLRVVALPLWLAAAEPQKGRTTLH